MAAAAALLAVTAAPAGAEESTGRHFAEHVRMHAADMGFSGTQNPASCTRGSPAGAPTTTARTHA
ncbi:hypothetical protein G7085_10990 [Tessaracoccus sp. HDW20]|uniref:hypothetical protein n=1 Tax=Tessaracoccus coleopterorum TaxID=2714950 RepID=UPI0018D3DB69|nr:hypothetical protein [Tessaracoccus coleopterorum]NHB84959.1 hypothetical protein [Tessaracoccus coleopterorum]